PWDWLKCAADSDRAVLWGAWPTLSKSCSSRPGRSRAMHLKKGWSFRMSDDRPFQVFRRLVRYGNSSTTRIVISILGMGTSSLALLVLPWLIKETFQEAVLKQQAESLYRALALITADLLILGIARYITSDQLEFVALGIMQQLRNELVAKFL